MTPEPGGSRPRRWQPGDGSARVCRRHGRPPSRTGPGSGSSRRSLLKRGLLGGALLAAGGRGVPRAPRRGRGAAPRRRALRAHPGASSRCSTRWPGGWCAPVRAGPAWIRWASARAADRIAARAEPERPEGAAAAARPVRERARRASSSAAAPGPSPGWTAPSRTRCSREWRDSQLAVRRTGYAALRTLVLAGYYQSPAVWPRWATAARRGASGWARAPRSGAGGGEPRPDGNGVVARGAAAMSPPGGSSPDDDHTVNTDPPL